MGDVTATWATLAEKRWNYFVSSKLLLNPPYWKFWKRILQINKKCLRLIFFTFLTFLSMKQVRAVIIYINYSFGAHFNSFFFISRWGYVVLAANDPGTNFFTMSYSEVDVFISNYTLVDPEVYQLWVEGYSCKLFFSLDKNWVVNFKIFNSSFGSC